MSKHTPEATAWMAGFFEGEGCICLHRRKNVRDRLNARYGVRVAITNTERPLLEVYCEHWGGSIRPKERSGFGRKPCWAWDAGARIAERFLRAILPHLRGVKKKRAILAIEFQEHLRPEKKLRGKNGKIIPISKEELQWRENMFHKMKTL